MVFSLSALLTSVIFFSLRMRLGALVPIRWRLPECMRRILPVPVILKRLAAPRCVFSLSFGFDRLRGIAVNPLFLRIFLDTAALAAKEALPPLVRPAWCSSGGARTLFRSQQRHQDVAFHAGRRLDRASVADFAQQARHLGAADFLVRHFAATVKNHGANFVAFTQESNNLVLANLKIMFRSGRPELHFFQRRATAALALLMRLLTLLIEKLAVIGDLANWRIGGGRNLHQVQSLFASHAKRFKWLHYPELAALFVNHPDFASANPIVDTDSVAHLPEIPLCDKSPSSR